MELHMASEEVDYRGDGNGVSVVFYVESGNIFFVRNYKPCKRLLVFEGNNC